VIEEAPNYGEEWRGNYELKWFRGAKKEERCKGSSFWVVGKIASREDQSSFWRESKADLDREVQNTLIGERRFLSSC
jgi:hypothetical protein